MNETNTPAEINSHDIYRYCLKNSKVEYFYRTNLYISYKGYNIQIKFYNNSYVIRIGYCLRFKPKNVFYKQKYTWIDINNFENIYNNTKQTIRSL
jgi:uncharacterized Fe-S cluster protein YjdI